MNSGINIFHILYIKLFMNYGGGRRRVRFIRKVGKKNLLRSFSNVVYRSLLSMGITGKVGGRGGLVESHVLSFMVFCFVLRIGKTNPYRHICSK